MSSRGKKARTKGTVAEDLEKILAFAMRERFPCIVCGGQSSMVGLFFPDDSRAFGAPEGKHRSLIYATCGEHTAEDCENALLVELASSLGKPQKTFKTATGTVTVGRHHDSPEGGHVA